MLVCLKCNFYFINFQFGFVSTIHLTGCNQFGKQKRLINQSLLAPCCVYVKVLPEPQEPISPRADSHKRLIFRVICPPPLYNIGLMFFYILGLWANDFKTLTKNKSVGKSYYKTVFDMTISANQVVPVSLSKWPTDPGC